MICNREAASVEAAYKRWGDDVNFFGIAWAGDLAAFDDFVERHGLTFPQIDDRSTSLYAHFGVPAQPAFAVVDRTGELELAYGAVEPDEIDELVGAALAG